MFDPNMTWKYKRRPNKIINFCKYYKLEDNLEILAFNKRFSNPKLRWVLRKRHNYTRRLLKAITERITNANKRANFLFIAPGRKTCWQIRLKVFIVSTG